MNAHRDDLEVLALLGRGGFEPWVPLEGSRDSAPVHQRYDQLVLGELDLPGFQVPDINFQGVSFPVLLVAEAHELACFLQIYPKGIAMFFE